MQYRIRELREKKKMTQQELSQLSGVSRSVIIQLESQKNYETTVGTLEAIAKALNVTVKYLFLP